MRIAILSCFYPYRGGISQFNANLLEELGKSHCVKAFNFSRQYPEFLFPGKTQYVTADDEAAPVDSERILDSVNPVSWVRTASAIRKWKPDLLVIRYWMSYLAPCLGYVARRMKGRCKVVAILDNVVPHEKHFFDSCLTRYFLSGVSGGVTLCNEVAGDLAALRDDLPRTMLPHPIYTHFGEKLERSEAETRLGLEHGKKNLLFFGLIREYKGLDILLDAFGMLDEDYQLIIAGEPYGSFERYRQAIGRLEGKNRVFLFPDYIRDSEVKLYFSAADVTVLPYRSATQSGVSSISYHFGVPLIVTDVGGLRETIEARGTGLVASEVSAGCIAGNIRRFFAEDGLRAGLESGIEAERKRLSWSEFAKGLIEFAERI